ncbi:peptidoglycan-binding domain-containing protein [Methanosarcina sp.]|uniref:peptidoglycan-binding domain-containing protein n=1 Tax=Methanosarcina sp. TaxID=2213 RepID=UPI003C7512DA
MTIGDGHDLRSPRFAGDEVLEACYDNERVLQRGDSGSAVRKVQEALIILDIPVPEVGANGIFGGETELAVRSYQEARGLKVDGIIGPDTIGSLDAEFLTGVPKSSALPTTEPQVSEVPTPLVPESPVRSPRASPVEPVRAPEVPPLEVPRAPKVAAPAVKIPRPPEAPAAEPPILTTQAVPLEQTPARVTRPITPPVTRLPHTVDSQGRKFYTAGTWSGSNSSFEAEAGKSIRLEVNNLNVNESSIRIKTNTGEVKESVLQSNTLVDFEFSSAGPEPLIWRFYIETDSEDSLIEWKLYSNWVPEKSE